MKIIFLTSLHLGLKHKMFGDFVERHAGKFIVSKLFIDIMTSEWSVKGKFQKVLSFSRRYIHSRDRKIVLKFLFPLLPLLSKLCVLLFVIQINEKFSGLRFIMIFFLNYSRVYFHSSIPTSVLFPTTVYLYVTFFHVRNKRIYRFPKTSRPSLGPTEPPA